MQTLLERMEETCTDQSVVQPEANTSEAKSVQGGRRGPLKFPLTTAGYIGLEFPHASLNSDYLSRFWSLPLERIQNEYLVFPQRVPRLGFFEECLMVERSWFGNEYLRRKDVLEGHCTYLMCTTPESPELVNLLHLALRYGCHIEAVEGARLSFNVRLILENMRLSHLVSQNITPSLERLYALVKERVEERDWLYFNALNRFIVTAARHHRNSTLFEEVSVQVRELISEIVAKETSNLRENIQKATIMRGLAMAKGLEFSIVTELLDGAEELLRKLKTDDELEKIVVKETLWTLCLTQFKWQTRLGNGARVQKYREQMLRLDPWDATHYGEFGLAAMKAKDMEEAQAHFRRAVTIGPPSLAMNYYFLAQTYKEASPKQYCRYLRLAAEIDDLGISPRLELFQFYLDHKDIPRSEEIRMEIVDQPELFDQLTPEEQEIICRD